MSTIDDLRHPVMENLTFVVTELYQSGQVLLGVGVTGSTQSHGSPSSSGVQACVGPVCGGMKGIKDVDMVFVRM